MTVSTKKSTNAPREKCRTNYRHFNLPVCKFLFAYLHTISVTKLEKLVAHNKSVKGVIPRKLKLGNQKIITYEQCKAFQTFMQNFLEQHSLVLPGQVSGLSREATEVLPSHMTKKSVFEKYVESFDDDHSLKLHKLKN